MISTPPASEVLTEAQANETAIVANNTQSWINAANIAIGNASALGRNFVNCENLPRINVSYIINYFIGLGYKVNFPNTQRFNLEFGTGDDFIVENRFDAQRALYAIIQIEWGPEFPPQPSIDAFDQ